MLMQYERLGSSPVDVLGNRHPRNSDALNTGMEDQEDSLRLFFLPHSA